MRPAPSLPLTRAWSLLTGTDHCYSKQVRALFFLADPAYQATWLTDAAAKLQVKLIDPDTSEVVAAVALNLKPLFAEERPDCQPCPHSSVLGPTGEQPTAASPPPPPHTHTPVGVHPLSMPPRRVVHIMCQSALPPMHAPNSLVLRKSAHAATPVPGGGWNFGPVTPDLTRRFITPSILPNSAACDATAATSKPGPSCPVDSLHAAVSRP